MIKPDGVHRGLIGKLIQRFEENGFKLIAMKFMWPTVEHLERHYAELSDRPFFGGLIKYMRSGPVVPMVWEGINVVKIARKIIGATNPMDAAPGTIRGDMSVQVGRNLIHGSDGIDSAKNEIAIWFTENELVNWNSALERWIDEDNN